MHANLENAGQIKLAGGTFIPSPSREDAKKGQHAPEEKCRFFRADLTTSGKKFGRIFFRLAFSEQSNNAQRGGGT